MGILQGSLNSLLKSATYITSSIKSNDSDIEIKKTKPTPSPEMINNRADPVRHNYNFTEEDKSGQVKDAENRKRKRPKYQKAMDSANKFMVTAQDEKRAKRGGVM